MITDDIYLLLNAAQRESLSPSRPKISVTGWHVFLAGWHLCHPVVVLKDALVRPSTIYSIDIRACTNYRAYFVIVVMSKWGFCDESYSSHCNQLLRQQPASFFASSIQKLVDRWDKCFNEFGRYVENETLMFDV